MTQFLYLYRRQPQAPLSPQQMQERMKRWRAWFDSLEKGGHLVSLGQPLANEGGAVVRAGKGRTSDGPYAETKDVVIGYSLIEAEDLSQAKALTAGWPGFDDDALIEIRPIAKM